MASAYQVKWRFPRTSPSVPLTIITHGTVGPVTPTSSVRALRTIAGYIPSRQASSFAQDAINLAGDYLTGGSSLREEARLIKWRHAQIKLFTIAMDEVGYQSNTRNAWTDFGRLDPWIVTSNARLDSIYSRVTNTGRTSLGQSNPNIILW